jgi:hypothetical protein
MIDEVKRKPHRDDRARDERERDTGDDAERVAILAGLEIG